MHALGTKKKKKRKRDLEELYIWQPIFYLGKDLSICFKKSALK